MASSARAASATHLPYVPIESCVSDIGITPARDVRPTVGLMPTIPLTMAGQITDVSVSVPKAIGTILLETETAEPELEPSSICVS